MAGKHCEAPLYSPKPDLPGPAFRLRRRSSALARKWTFPVTGAVAGVASATVFDAIHAFFISDIWYSIVPTAVVAAVCGACVAASFGILVREPTVGAWLLYNATFIGLFTLLGIASVVIYEPVTTIPALLTLHGPPTWLFEQTVPLQIGFTIAAAALITPVFGHRWWHVGPVLVTATVLVFALGLNISIFGLVEIPRSSAYVVAELVGLVLAIVVVYAVVFLALEMASAPGRERGPCGDSVSNMMSPEPGRSIVPLAAGRRRQCGVDTRNDAISATVRRALGATRERESQA